MKFNFSHLVVYLFCLLFAVGLARSSHADSFSYQGVLNNTSGGLQLGTFDFTFRLYRVPADGEVLWEEIHPDITTDEGRFKVELGAFNPDGLTTLINSEPELWLAIAVDDGAEMLPRQRLSATPRALRAGFADELAPGAVTGEMIASGTVSLDKLAPSCEPGEILVMGESGWQCGAESVCSPEPEICDGLDNDCDGLPDNGLDPLTCNLQTGVCLGSTKQCGGSAGYLECGAPQYGPTYEPEEVSCDGLDNDCDGSSDENLPTPACVNQEGVCAGSVRTCGGESGWLACEPADYGPNYQAEESTCDYLDNDCDGEIDEGYSGLGNVCAEGIGACEQMGVLVCDESGTQTVCSATSGLPSDEICDYLDNDCDGEVDQPFKDPGTGAYIDDQNCGACGYDCTGRLPNATSSCLPLAIPTCAVLECSQGWVDLNLNPTDGCECFAVEEICDGLDNDCDGEIDEDLGPEACSLQTGVCNGSQKQCGGAEGYFDCGRTEYGSDFEPAELSCDGKDNDCDSETDEGFGLNESCGLGACAGGFVTCSNDGGVECSTQSLATPETCNGIDDDCDGIVDEGC